MEQELSEQPLVSSLVEQGPEFIELINFYVERLPSIVNELRSAFDSRDWEALKAQAHDLKATGGGYGYMDVTNCALEIEHAAKAADEVRVPPLFAHLDSLVRRIKLGAVDL
jgi:HPt (histidine-containing phosphotransfer) domain-containing protein